MVTVAAPVAARICSGLSDDERARLSRVEYQGIVCASVLLRKPLAGFYVTNITDSWVPFTAVIEMSSLVDRSQFGGNTLVYLPKYVGSDDPLFSVPDQEVEEQFLGALFRMYPFLVPDDVLCFRVSRERFVHRSAGPQLLGPLPSQTDLLAWGPHSELGAHRQRDPQRQRDGQARRRGAARSPCRERRPGPHDQGTQGTS